MNQLHAQLFYPIEFKCEQNGVNYCFTVKMKDIQGRPDCRLDDFSNNLWIRPNKALSLTWQGYKDEKQLQKAVKASLSKRGFKNITLVFNSDNI